MKLRIRGNSVRFRLSQTEMAQLMEEGAVSDAVEFAPATRLDYRVEIAPAEAITATFADGRIHIVVPEDLAKRWERPDEVALTAEQGLAGGKQLRILLEKDFACLTPRQGEDETDTFPNPAAGGAATTARDR